MPTTRIKEKISTIVESQLPEFIRSDYPTFVAFLQAYYRYIEQDQEAYELIKNALSYRDIDSTAASFVQYFLQNYATDLPLTALANRKLLVKRIKDLYEAKGSELSFQLLFRLFYDVDVEVKYPYEYVLRPSDGRWEQLLSIRAETESGSISDIANRILIYEKNGFTYEVPIVRVRILSGSIVELFFQTNTPAPYEVGDYVYVKNNSQTTIYVGRIKGSPNGYRVSNFGQGFKVGSMYTIDFEGGVNMVIQITKITESGGIAALRFISFGYNYPTTFEIELFTVELFSYGVSRNIVRSFESILGVTDTITVSKSDYFAETYTVSNPDYVVQLYQTVTYDPNFVSSTVRGRGDSSSIEFTTGALCRYPGQFLNNKGFLSEPDVRLQDDKLFQPFAYQLESELDIETFYDITKKIVHPAGTNLFNNVKIDTEANLISSVSLVSDL
jgi:hypothetical protein